MRLNCVRIHYFYDIRGVIAFFGPDLIQDILMVLSRMGQDFMHLIRHFLVEVQSRGSLQLFHQILCE